MRNFTNQTKLIRALALFTLLLLLSVVSVRAQLPIKGIDVVRCGAGPVDLVVEWDGQVLDPSNVKWYTEPFYGTPFHTGLSYTTDYLELTTTFYVDYIDENLCGECDRLLIKAIIFDAIINNQVFYESNTFCNSASNIYFPTIVGVQGGTFSVQPVGGAPQIPLVVNSETGAFNPQNVSSGTYTITYLPPDIPGCDSDPVSIDVTITDSPLEPEISYIPDHFCAYPEAQTIDVDFSIPAYTPPTGASFSAVPTGLCINSTSGQINPQNCLTGNYTITYYVPGGGGCPPVIKTTQVTVLQLPTASINYNSPFTLNMGPQPVSITGSGDYLGGTFTHDGNSGDLDLDATTGEIIPANSVQGSYLITYTLAAVSPCVDGLVATISIEILSLPVAQISAVPTEVCQYSADEPEVTFTGAAGLPPYTLLYSINDGLTQDIITAGNAVIITHPTLVTGSYIYKIHSVTDDNGSIRVYDPGNEPFATINVNAQSHGLFEYADSPYCSDGSNPVPTMLDGGVKGTFTSTAGLVFVDETTGEINISLSIPGTYAVSNTIAALGGCPESVTIVDVTITALPLAGFSYEPAYCNNGSNPTPILDEGAQIGIFSFDQPGLVFVSPTTGEINLASSLPGTYIITNTVAAADGCGVVTATDEVTIEPLPLVTNDDEFFICSNTSPDIALTASLASSFTWTIGNITGDITGAEAGSGAVIEQVLINPSNTEAGTAEYLVVPTSTAAGCVGDAFTITVTVKPLPVLSSSLAPTAICSELAFEYEATSSATGATFSWSRAAVAGIQQGPTTGGTAFINEVLTNTTNASIDVVYEFTITADGCSNKQNVTIGVNPTPSVTNIELAQAICSGGSTTAVELTSDIVGATLSWIAYPSAGITGSVATGTGTIPVQTLTNSLTTDGTVTYVIAPTLGNCYGVEVEYVVTVYALPVCEVTGPDAVTYADVTEFAAPLGMTSYVWNISGDGTIIGANNGQTVDVNADAAGSYTLSLTIINGNGCTSSCDLVVIVNRAELMVIAVDKDKAYDGLVFPYASYTVTYDGFVSNEDEGVLGGTLTFAGSAINATDFGNYTIAPAGLTSGNYDIAFIDGELEITKATLIVTAADKDKVYDGLVFPYTSYTVTYDGIVTGEDQDDLSGVLSFVGTAISATEVGDYVISPQGLSSENYNITFENGALRIWPVHNTTQNKYYSTIQAAIDEANAADAIQVANGSYNLLAPIKIDKSIILTGNVNTPEDVIVNAPTDGGVDRDVFQIISSGVTIQGFTIQGAKDQSGTADGKTNGGIMVGGDKYILGVKPAGATDFTFSSWWGFGVQDVIIKNNRITNNSYGIFIFHSQNITIEGNEIFANTQDVINIWSGKGISVYSQPAMTLANKVSSGSPLLATSNLTIKNNEIYNNELMGIELNYSEIYNLGADPRPGPFNINTIIEGNSIYNNGGTTDNIGLPGKDLFRGISANGNEENVSVINNEIYGHLPGVGRFQSIALTSGMRLSSTKDWTVENNKIYNNVAGINAYGTSTGINVNENAIFDNAQGVVMASSNTGTVVNNAIYNNNVSTWQSDGIEPYGVNNLDIIEAPLIASCNWWGTINFSEILPKVSVNVEFVNYLIPDAGGETHLWSEEDKYSCTGIAPLTITAGSDSKVYDGIPLTNAGYSVTAGALLVGHTLQAVTLTGSQAAVGTSDNIPSAAVILDGSSNNVTAKYNITYVNGNLEVTSRPLEITANNVSKSYGNIYTFENNEYTLTNGTSLAGSHTMTLTLSSAGAEADALAGFYLVEIFDIVIKDAGNTNTTDNYDINLINGTLGVMGPVIVYNHDPSEPNTEIIATHMTIQSAIDAETTVNGHYISVASGNYDELINVTKGVTISGYGAVNTLIQSSNALSTNILSITASNVAIKDIAIVGPGGSSPPSRGIHINGILSGIALVNVISNQHLYGVHVSAGSDITNLTLTNTVLNINGNGLQIDAEAKVDGLTITNGEMDGNLFGFSTAATLDNYDNSDDLNNVSITGTSFSGNMYFGLMFNKGKNVNLNGITVNGNGNVSGAPGSGIYFTWREGTFSNIIVQNSTITNNGQNAGANDGGGILIRPRANASASGISIENNLISGNGAAGNSSAGIRVLKNDENTGTDPGISINGNSITSNANHGITSTTSANIDASCNWWGTANYNEILLIVSTKVQFVNYLIPGAGDTYPWSGVDTYSCTGVE
ncbi:MAG: right-handed parallel beta-helix repeat-containing protein [Bacteroidales bacterium]|nr:right-handed parallel beta-helix repeat-containing protein [Bacteroidales bacterium]